MAIASRTEPPREPGRVRHPALPPIRGFSQNNGKSLFAYYAAFVRRGRAKAAMAKKRRVLTYTAQKVTSCSDYANQRMSAYAKADMSASGLLPCKLTPNPIPLVSNPCCNCVIESLVGAVSSDLPGSPGLGKAHRSVKSDLHYERAPVRRLVRWSPSHPRHCTR